MIILGMLCMMMAGLFAIFLVGWFILAPVIEWLGSAVLALAIKGSDYHAIVKAQQSGEVQDPST